MTDQPVALVSGANTGLGFQIAKDLGEHGFIVLVGSRDKGRGEAAAAEISAGAHALQLDVTDAASIAAAAERVRDEFGRLDVLVNNAGVSFLGDPATPLRERAASGLLTVAPLDVVRRIYETNVFGVIALTQAMLPLLRQTPGAHIVNVGSGGGSLAANSDPNNPHRAMFGVYSASKSALHAVSVAFAAALEPEGINVNIADPGPNAASTALNNFEGTTSAEEGARHIAEVARNGADGRTGTFTNVEGPLPW